MDVPPRASEQIYQTMASIVAHRAFVYVVVVVVVIVVVVVVVADFKTGLKITHSTDRITYVNTKADMDVVLRSSNLRSRLLLLTHQDHRCCFVVVVRRCCCYLVCLLRRYRW